MPESVVSLDSATLQDVVDRGYHVLVLLRKPTGYEHVAQWRMGAVPELVESMSPNEGLGRSMVSRLVKHLHREGVA